VRRVGVVFAVLPVEEILKILRSSCDGNVCPVDASRKPGRMPLILESLWLAVR